MNNLCLFLLVLLSISQVSCHKMGLKSQEAVLGEDIEMMIGRFDGRKTFFYNGDRMWVIDKYNPSKNQKGKAVTTKQKETLQSLLTFGDEQLIQLEKELLGVNDCDSALPFIIQKRDKAGKILKVVLRDTCPPENGRKLMESLNLLFRK